MANNRRYTPDRQDIIMINFDPSVNEEMRFRHPALVVSNARYSELTGLVIVCPITHATNNRLRKSGLFVPVTVSRGNIDGYVNPLQIFSFSVRGRGATYAGQLTDSAYAQVHQILSFTLGFDEEEN